MIYLDNSATTRIDDEVLDSMRPFLECEYGNPSAKYYWLASHAYEAIENARERVANLLGVSPERIIFTAGATESTNMIIKGYLDYQKFYVNGKNNVVTTKAEHEATMNVCRYLNGDIYSNKDSVAIIGRGNYKVDRGYSATFVDVNNIGIAEPQDIKKAITEDTAMVSTIFVNNEVGSITDVEAISQICHSAGVMYHVDATQAIGKIDIDLALLGCDFLSCSSHKIYGPKGVGAAVLGCDEYGVIPISAFMHGGEQEGGLRAGTLPVANIVGFGKAAEIAKRDMEQNKRHILELDRYAVQLLQSIERVRFTNPSENRLPGIISIIVEGENFHNERFVKKVSDEIAISTGSACSIGKPSHVLQAMGMGNMTNRVLRISLSKQSTKNEIDGLIATLKQAL